MVERRKDTGRTAAVVAGLAAAVTGIVLLFKKAEADLPPADVILSDLLIEPTDVYVGETVQISVTATNIGDTAGSYEINCEVV